MSKDRYRKQIAEMRRQMAQISNEAPKRTQYTLHYDFLDEREETLSKIEELESIMATAPEAKTDDFKNEIIMLLKEVIQSLQNQNDIQKHQIDKLFKRDKDKDKK